LAAAPGWVISGSLCGWGDSFRQQFDLAIFLLTPTDIRLARLRDRELARFGNRLGPGGDMHEENKAFMAWASQYDHASLDMRSRQLHENWLKTLTCPVIRLDGSRPLSELSEQVRATQFRENPDSGLV
jgi:adenylate kinase family enzyme